MTPRDATRAARWTRSRLLEALAEGEATASVLEQRIPLPGGRPDEGDGGVVYMQLHALERMGLATWRRYREAREGIRRPLKVWRLTVAGERELAVRQGWAA